MGLQTETLGTVAAAGSLTWNVNVTAPSTDGAIGGTLTVSGPRATSLRRVQASGPIGRSATPSVSGAYQIGQLSAGTYDAYAELYYNNNRTYYRSPYGGTLTGNPSIIIAGNTVTRDFNVQQSFINGTLALTGTRTLAHADYAQVYVSGQSGTSTQSGYGQDEVTRPSGEFELIVSPGSWSMNNYHYINFSVPTAGQYLQGQLGIYDYLNAASPIFVGEGDEATRNLTYETGTVTAVLRSSGVTFGSPRVYMSCTDTVNGQQRTFSYGYFYGNQSNVTVAPVTMVGIKGRCSVTTYGRITGSSGETVFGTVTVDVVPGSDLTIDVGGPTLTVTAPTANTAFTSGPISVTGKATDDEQVSSVTVNGNAATLTSTNNPSDPREVSFTVSVPLVAGANPISTIATDNTGKTAADSRNVYLDSLDPAVTWTPADGASYPTPGNVTISGNATDNVGVSSITLNGAIVYTNSGTPQTSVNFTRVLNLQGGTHQLTLVVKDLGNRTITETRTITVIAPPSTTSVVTSPNPSVSGQQVTLAATVSGAAGTPTGSVQFLADGTSLGSAGLSDGGASLATTGLAVGSRSISAIYNGSTIYVASTGTTTQVVNPISTVTTVTSGTNPSTYLNPVTFTATVSNVSPGTGTPTGTVQFKVNGAPFSTPVGLSGSATATLAITGTAMPAGSVTIEAVYTPSSNTRSPSTGTFTQAVNKRTPTVNWNTPLDIFYGTLLGPSQLNANASGLPGTFVYSPPAGTKLDAGNGQTLSVIFTPTDAANYNTQTRSVPINVLKATPSVSTSGGIFTYDGAPHGSTGASNVPGTFSYSYTPGGTSVPVNASATPYQVTATFTPDDTVNYNGATATSAISITKATPVVTWANPASITFGTLLDGTQLNATSPVNGTFAYSPAADAQLNAGNGQTLSVTFTPADTINYNPRTATVFINVVKATPTLSTSGGTFTYNGAPHGSTGTSSVSGAFTYQYSPGGSSPPVNASATPYQVTATFTPSNPANYSGGTATNTITIGKATPTVNWSNPADIVYGTLLGGAQLNASASVGGTFAYTPAANTQLNAGNGQTLSVTFTPTDTGNYNTKTATVSIDVLKATPTLSTSGGTFTYNGAPHGSTGSSSVPGSFAYQYSPGGTAPVNASATPYGVTATFTPTDTANYNGGTATNTITIVKATPAVSWNNPTDIVYGMVLGGTQLNATASVDGSFAYTPAANAHLNAGNGQTLSVTFTPTDTGNYNAKVASVAINVLKATPTLSTSGGTFVYDGAPHGSTGSSSIAGTFAYQYSPGGTAPVSASATPYDVTATFTPADTANYNGGTATNTITIVKATPTVSWNNPANIVYGAALGGAQLNATASVDGTFAYSPAADAQLNAGNGQTLSVIFTPTDAGNYNTQTGSVSINVLKASVTLSTSGGTFTYDGAPHGSTATSSVPGTFTYVYTPGSSNAPVNASATPYQVTATFTPTDATNYSGGTATNTITIGKATPAVNWSNPANIVYGTALGGAQLNATASVDGTFAYTPAANAQLNAGNGQTLSVTFTPTDTGNYNGQTGSASINVLKASVTLSTSGGTFVYDGAPHGSTGTSSIAGTFAYQYSSPGGTAPVNASATPYEVTATFTPSDTTNYGGGTATNTITISRAPSAVSLLGGTYLHDGSPHPAAGSVVGVANAVIGTPAITYSPNVAAPVAPGIYAAIGSFSGNDNYLPSGATATVVINAAPEVVSVTGPDDPLGLGSAATINVSFSDDATGDAHTCQFAWNDGTPDTKVTLTSTQSACSATHPYSVAGVYSVGVTVRDDDGYAVGTTFKYVVVFDPSAGFVTGGGWIMSPAGAYANDPALAGKATFGFVSKYKNGSTVPTGNTEFEFHVGGLRFKSTVYEWLVVAGAKAQYKGSGTINGGGDYDFRLTARDGQAPGGGGADKFRITIWDRANGGIVYDNRRGEPVDLTGDPQQIGGGSIVIHK